MAHNSAKTIKLVFGKPGFWAILILFALISILHYRETTLHLAFLTNVLINIGLTRHAFERILYLFPIFLSGFFFGWKGSLIGSFIALALMVPLDFYFSQYETDALFETGAIFVLGILLSATFGVLYKEKRQRLQLESLNKQFRESEERYRQLFENAYDAIFIHDTDGNIIAANKACVMLTGYDIEDLYHLKVTKLFSEESWLTAEAIEHLLLSGEDASKAIEVKLIKKDKSEIFIHLSISPAQYDHKPVAFQYTARDISEQKRMQENLYYYLQQATRAQEEERKRIALELHDETIQDLIALSRQLDMLASKGSELSPENGRIVKDLRQQNLNIIQSLRHISQDLRPVTLDRLGLLAALGHLASEVTNHSDIATRVNVVGTERRLPEEEELMLFRITQEALANVWRHSHAKKAEITIEFSEQKIKVTITDDGKGFSLNETKNSLAKDGKLGLIGMQERARLINGHIQIQSEPGKGTSITIVAPI